MRQEFGMAHSNIATCLILSSSLIHPAHYCLYWWTAAVRLLPGDAASWTWNLAAALPLSYTLPTPANILPGEAIPHSGLWPWLTWLALLKDGSDLCLLWGWGERERDKIKMIRFKLKTKMWIKACRDTGHVHVVMSQLIKPWYMHKYFAHECHASLLLPWIWAAIKPGRL